MANWRNKIEIKKYLSEDDSNTTVLNVVNKLIPQLESIYRREVKVLQQRKRDDLELQIDEYFLDEIEEVIEDFRFVKECVEKNEEPLEYHFDSWCEAFNEYMSKLYDLADVVIDDSKGWSQKEKFLWVG